MLRVIINNTSDLNLSQDFSLTRVVKSPLFFTDEYQGNVSYNLNVPVNDVNRKIFGFYEVPYVNNQTYSYDCVIMFSGFVLMSGKLVILNAKQSDSYVCYVKDESALFNNAIKDKHLNDFKYLDIADYVNLTTAYDPDVHKGCLFPIYNTDFFKDRLTQYESFFSNETAKYWHTYYANNFLNYYSISLTSKAVTDRGGEVHLSFDAPIRTLCPFPFVRHLLDYIINEVGFNLTSNWFASSDQLKAICLYLNWDVTNKEIENRYYAASDDYRLYWYYKDGSGPDDSKIAIDGCVHTFIQKMPDLTISEFLLAIQNYFNLFLYVENDTVSLVSRLDYLESSSIDDWSEKGLSNIDTIATKSTFKLGWIDDGLDSAIHYEEVDLNSSLFKGEVATVASLPTATYDQLNDIYYVASVDAYYKLSEETVPTLAGDGNTYDHRILKWISFSFYKDFQPVVLNPGEKNSYEYIPNCFTFDMGAQKGVLTVPFHGTYPQDTNWHIRGIQTEIQGNRMDMLAVNKMKSLRFMLYHGWQTITQIEEEIPVDYDLPYGSVDSLDKDNNPISGFDINFSIRKMYDKYWAPWADFIANGKEIRFNTYLNESDLSKMDILKKKQSKEGVFFVKQISTPIYVDRIGMSTIDCKFL